VSATASSMLVFAGGYALAALSGVVLGVLMGGFPRFGATLDIYVNALNATPRVAFVPLIIVWFGLGMQAKIVVVWFMAAFPILLNTYAGVLNTDAELIEAARSFGASSRQVFRTIMLPSAVPYIITGLRLGGASAMLGTVVAELYTALSGLGYLIAQYGGSFQTARYFAPVLVLAMMGVLVSQGLKVLERRLAQWRHV
jgi:ABC-type nitrate/sulfonate/bicarbonate transport system permease component